MTASDPAIALASPQTIGYSVLVSLLPVVSMYGHKASSACQVQGGIIHLLYSWGLVCCLLN